MRMREKVLRYPDRDKTVLSTYAGHYTLNDLDGETDRYQSLLGGKSLKGMKVGILVPAVASYLPLVLAVNELGGTVVPLSWQFRTRDLEAVLAFLDPHIVFTPHEYNGFPFAGVIRDWAVSTGKETAIYVSEDCRSWRLTGLKGAARELEREPADFICCSSGSTGTPKGLVVGAGTFDTSIRVMEEINELRPDDRVFVNAPTNSVFGLAALFGVIHAGARLVYPDSFDLPAMLSFMETACCNKVISTPSIFKAIYAFAKSVSPAVPGRLELVSVSGEMVSEHYAAAFEGMDGCRFVSIYGSSEIGGALYCDLRGPMAFALIDGVSFKVADGELMLKSPAAFSGYYRSPALTQACFDDEGWFHSGDFVRLDADGRIEIVGRKKEMIKKGGQQIIPAEVERELARHPLVKQAVVIGAPHPVYGEQVAAFVVPAGKLAAEQLYAFCRDRIAGYKVPDLIRVLDELPMAQGKIDKLALRERI